MILRFNTGSDAEQEVKNLITKRDESREYAKDIIEEITGVRPLGFGFSWFFGISYSWLEKNTGFDKTAPETIDGMTFTRETDGIRYFKPNNRTKKGKQISRRFQDDQIKLRVDGESMKKFGVYVIKDRHYCDWRVGEDENGVWMGISSSALDWMTEHPDVRIEIKNSVPQSETTNS